MSAKPRCVVDTNVLVSAALFNGSTPWRAVEAVVLAGVLLVSPETADEIQKVAARPMFDRYVTWVRRRRFLDRLMTAAQTIEPAERIRVCRDPRDDKFLELAIAGQADYVITGDADLLTLNPFRHVPIVTPQQFLDAGGFAGERPTDA